MGGSESKPSSSCSDSTDREEGGGLYESQKSALKTTAVAVGTVAVVGAALAWGVASMVSSASESESDDNRKMMKAPGKNGEYMRRDTFERDPKSYFSDLRRNKD